MKKKVFIIAGFLFAAVLAVGYIFYQKNTADVPVNIVSTGQKIKIRDIKMFLKGFPAQSVNEDPRKYFSEEIINVFTVRFLKFIQTQIEFTSREEHLKAVKAYLLSVLDPQKADEMFALYEKFIDYEIGLQEKIKSWGLPKTADELLNYLQNIQDYRRDVFSADIADGLWGAEVMAMEYSIRKNRITADPNLYGAEKEKQIKALKEEMWGKDANMVEDPPQTDPEKYSSYQEKQVLYQKDLQELPEEQRVEKIREFRKEYFSAEQLARLEQVDAELAAEKTKEADYYSQEKTILTNPALDDAQKAQALRTLQDNTFGDDADAFRRRQAIQKGLQH